MFLIICFIILNDHRDGRSTLRLLMKYLVKKLGLENESEVIKVDILKCDCCSLFEWKLHAERRIEHASKN